MLGAQETIGKICLWRDNVRTGIAGNGPAPNKSIVHSLYHFDLAQNILQKPVTIWNQALEIINRGLAVNPAKDKTAIIPGPEENLGRG